MSILNKIEQQQIKNFHWSFFGCFMQQTPRAVLSLNKLLNAENFDTIIELGTHDGGLSSLFALYCAGSNSPSYASHANEPSLYKNQTHHKIPKQFYTFDHMERDLPRIRFLQQMGAKFSCLDFLNNKENIENIGSIIQKGGRVLLLCDGGDKPKEFALFSPYLKTGDIIMAHDWAYDKNAFEEIKQKGIWYGLETEWYQIEEYCKKHGIREIYQEEFDSVVWFCGIKE
jgi:hypothetical protein